MIHFICALKCEASPLIQYYGMKRLQKAALFNMYVNDEHDISVTITGIGKLAAAAATSYSYAILKCGGDDVWLNLGVAGHRDFSIGSVYLANRIEDAGSKQVWHPQIVIDTNIPSAHLLSLDRPSTDYSDVMFDMEAAGFIATASRFATVKRVHSIKIISDNPEMPTEKITAKMVSELINAARAKVTTLAAQLNTLVL